MGESNKKETPEAKAAWRERYLERRKWELAPDRRRLTRRQRLAKGGSR